MSPRKGFALDWDALKREWLGTNETLNAFRARKGIVNHRNFYLQVKKGGWEDAKHKQATALEAKVQAAAVQKGFEEWEEEVALLKGIRAQVAHVLKGRIDKEGNVVRPIPAQELKALAEVVAKSVVAKKHIRGEPVGDEGGDKPGATHLHLHAYAVQVVNEIEADRDSPTPLAPPALGHKRGG